MADMQGPKKIEPLSPEAYALGSLTAAEIDAGIARGELPSDARQLAIQAGLAELMNLSERALLERAAKIIPDNK